jgi:hypothetical protein
VLAALDCPRCLELAARHAPETVELKAPRTVDLGAAAGYAIAEHFAQTAAPTQTCPDCRRVVEVVEYRNLVLTWMTLDRDP